MTWGKLLWIAALAGGSLLLSLPIVILILVKLPADYFLDSHQRDLWIDRHAVIRWSGRVLKNLLGVLLILLGGVMSVPGIPGQGLLTILLGIVLLDFPHKRQLERSVLRRRHPRRAINRLRYRFGQPPLQLDDDPPA